MTRLVMESAGLTLWPLASLVVFSVFVLLMLAWLFRKGSGGFYDGMSRMALDGAATRASARTGSEREGAAGNSRRTDARQG